MSFLGLNTALTGLRAGQTGLDTASNNIANANTQGYTRQRVALADRAPMQRAFGPVGAGVDVTGINRVREAFLDTRVRTTGATFTHSDTLASLLQRTEAVLGEPDNGLTASLGEVWDSFEDLALDPSDPATRGQTLGALKALAGRYNAVNTGWQQLAEDTDARLDVAVADTNAMLARVHELNLSIFSSTGPGGAPNNALDDRDLLLDELANAAGATFTASPDGMVRVDIGGVAVVDTDGGLPAGPLELAWDGAAVTIDGGVPLSPLGGGLAALERFVTTDLPERQAALEQFATTLAAALNDQHAAGFDPDGNPGGDLLELAGGVLAAVITDTGALAAASTSPVGAQDGTNASTLAALRTTEVTAGDGSKTIDARLRELVMDLARATATSTREADAQESILVGATSARQSVHGVSLDEEMVALVQHQRALEAASRVMTAIDQALDVLVNRTGVVGR